MSESRRTRWSRALFGCAGTDLPPEVVLIVRLVALAWILTGHALLLPARSAPFIDGLAPLADSDYFDWARFIVGLVCAVQIAIGRSIRASSLTLGCLIFASTLLSRAYFSNNRLYTACVLVLAGLSATRGAPTLLRAQVSLLYCAAGLDKLLDLDWRSGAFMRSFASGLARHGRLWAPGHDVTTPWAPARLFAQVVGASDALAALASWGTIFVELGIGLALLARRTRLAVATGIAFHTGLLVVTGSPMGMFFYAAMAAYLAFVQLSPAIEVRVSPRWRTLALGTLGALDADHRCRVEAGPSLSVTIEGETRAGAAAIVALALHLPAFYVVAAVTLAGPWFTPWSGIVVALLIFAVRPFAPSPERSKVRRVASDLDS